ncbi:uncharacterized protein LOC117167319 [Belonocnema kinseyi]|uniref:uncharacterized protein LOC117167319 n=1 Tax=Belonocnema kinseyi TaxID=2817044 RepID=UPI00143D3E66|nr:uncharacterized protein LOC117167319 [Belonocnema kinseyi]
MYILYIFRFFIQKEEGMSCCSFLDLTEADLNLMELNMDRTEFVVQEDGSLISECNDDPNASQRIRVRSDIQERRNTQSMTGTNKVPLHMFSRFGTVRATLLHRVAEGQALVLAANGSFTENNRRALMRILISELIKVHGSCYPPDEAKVALAQAIVTEFPLLRNTRTKKGYEHYYDEETRRGFIEYRLWNVRRTLSPSQKKYKTKALDSGKTTPVSPNINLLSQEELDSKIAWMKCTNPSDSNKQNIATHLQETLQNRRDWIIKKSPNISQILHEYPRLLDYNGEMINNEFRYFFKEKSVNFLARFPSYYCPRILEYAKLNRLDVYNRLKNITDVNLRALFILADLLRINNAMLAQQGDKGKGKMKGKKRQRSSEEAEMIEKEKIDVPSTFLVRFAGTPLPQSIQEASATGSIIIPPYIVCTQEENGRNSYFVQGDGWLIKPRNNNPVTAFDLLFKVYFALKICYPAGLQIFYNFIESYVYDLGTKARGVVTSLHVNLSNLKLDKIASEEFIFGS